MGNKKVVNENFIARKFFCIECKKRLVEIQDFDTSIFSVFTQKQFYCKNKNCKRYFLVAVGGMVEK